MDSSLAAWMAIDVVVEKAVTKVFSKENAKAEKLVVWTAAQWEENSVAQLDA